MRSCLVDKGQSDGGRHLGATSGRQSDGGRHLGATSGGQSDGGRYLGATSGFHGNMHRQMHQHSYKHAYIQVHIKLSPVTVGEVRVYTVCNENPGKLKY